VPLSEEMARSLWKLRKETRAADDERERYTTSDDLTGRDQVADAADWDGFA
jgi:hypothetical protein